jgi:CelD/BcsL family acetyltransferase involved in cellulose biosynthesis
LYVFQTRAWLENWFDAVGNRLPIEPCFVVVSIDDVPAYFFPFQVDTAGSVRELRWFGDDMIDYGAPIIGPAGGEDFAEVWESVLACLPEVDVIRLSKIPASVCGVDNPLCGLECRPYHNRAHFVELDGNWDQFYESHAGAKTRSTDRRKYRRLSGMGELELRVADGSDATVFGEIAAHTIKQKAQRYRDIHAPNVVARDGVSDLLGKPIESLIESGMLHISALVLDGKVITTHWGMVHGGRFYYYMPSYEDGPWMKYSPGRILLFELFKWCFERGVGVFDFTIGDESYKKDWCDSEIRLFHYIRALTKRGRFASLRHNTTAALLSSPAILSMARRVQKWFH